jgi:hypothetical protein
MATVEIENPNGGWTPTSATGFPKISPPARLAGSHVALFGNNKPNVDIFLHELSRKLRDVNGVAETAIFGKLSAAFPAPEDVLDKVARYQLAINAVGD